LTFDSLEAAMSDIPPLTHATPEQLAEAVERNEHSWFRSMVRVLNGDLEETDKLSRYHCAPGSPIFKGVWGARLAEAEADAAIEETIQWFKARNAPFFFWWVGHGAQPADLGERLLAHGFGVFEKDATAMVADIDALNWDNPRPVDLRLEPVMNETQLQHWKATFLESFGIPEWAGQAWVDATHTIGFGRAPWHLLLGTLGGEPVCFGLLYCGAGVAGLNGLGTRPAYRRQGIASAMQLERLRLAREMGYRYAVLTASEMGRSPYLKLGFRDTGRRVSRYMWRAA
jgi:GNAT superfamily N-acetyltransferase